MWGSESEGGWPGPFRRVCERTLIRLSAPHVDELVVACADGRWTRRRTGRVVRPEIREAILAVRQESVRRSRISMRGKHRLLHQYMAERFPDFPTKDISSCDTLTRIRREWFGPGGARQRHLGTAEMLDDTGPRVVVHRPGQVVALDSTPLPVKLRESVFGEPVSVMLTLALDVYTHSCCAFRLTMVSDTSVDIAMLLRDVMMPLPVREGWGEEMEWPYPGVPWERRGPQRPRSPSRPAGHGHVVERGGSLSRHRIPPTWMAAWGRFRPLEERLYGRRAELSMLFQRLTDHVADQPAVDYAARRKGFENWTLPVSDLQRIVENYPSRRRLIVGGSQGGARVRVGFSALVWSRLTGSEWRLARPGERPAERGRPGHLLRRRPHRIHRLPHLDAAQK
ncbi:hypothetical protein QF032_007590 [Streptomyces achromogenes]|nr:hypothetical protein [Streptomyces achromogenes]